MDNKTKLIMGKFENEDEEKRLVEMCNENLEESELRKRKGNDKTESGSDRKGNDKAESGSDRKGNDKVYKRDENNNIVRSHFFVMLNNVGGFICPLFRNVYNMIASCFNLVSSYILSSCNKNSFIVYFEEKYGKNHVEFFNGTLKDAINKSQKEDKLLLLYLHIDNDESEYFCKNIYTNIEIISFFENNCILYAQDISKHPFIELHDKINIYMFPQISILLTYASNIKELSVIYGQPSVNDIIQSIIECIEKADAEKKKAEKIKAEKIKAEKNILAGRNVSETVYRDRLLREEQDREYQEALKKDKAILEEKKKKENEKLLKIEKKKNYIKDIKNKRNEKSKKFPLNIESNDKITKILLRLPNGIKVQNHFSNNHTLRDIYDWAECCDILESDQTKKQNIHIPYKFELICGHTKYVLKNSTDPIKDFDLYPNAVLNMKSLDQSDNEE
ncbi:hypothetical protein, variant 1 [Plasmodium yoelii 17X]|uniref:UBX domain-containing protein n=1 Tax=Plasmodium yoelii 17X TaxID=1323249 RepID=V7PKQ7_PLAYE|nr:hypothetical protein YYC_02414 [Plasmodium yoelii 17X]ETB60024.1 hypothetical protein, variant 1 [Plasmodium yoelii 17X]